MLREPISEGEKKLAFFFKEFVHKNLLKHFRNSEETMTEWNYFSSLISQQYIDYEKLQVYVEVMSPGLNPSGSPGKAPYKTLKTPSEQKKTNSGIFKKDQLENQSERFDLQLNKTVGGNADRIKFTGMLQSKSNAYTLQSKEKKTFLKKQSRGVSSLIESISGLSNSMADNHARMETGGNRPSSIGSGMGNGIGNGVGNAMGNGIGNGIQNNGGSFYKWRPEGNYT